MAYKILVTLDGSLLSERALQPAVDLARLRNGELQLLRIPVEQETGCQEYLQRLADEIRDQGVTVSVEVAEGRPAQVVAERADQVDLLVMGSHGRTGVDRFILGSVTEQVIRSTRTPVMVVRENGLRLDSLGRILVGLDGSAYSHRAAEEAVILARLCGAQLVLLRVVEHLANKELAEKEAREYLEQRAATLPEELRATAVTACGSAARTIVQVALREGADLVVVGTHGRRGLDRLVAGSVAENVARVSTCPVLLVS